MLIKGKQIEREEGEAALKLDDNNATASPFMSARKIDLDAFADTVERERKAGLPDGWQSEFFPKVMAFDWDPINQFRNLERWLRRDGLLVLISASVELDGKRWLHVSLSRSNTLPSWRDVKEVKKIFIGKDRTALQVFPSESNYVNEHPYVLHMFSCLDGDALPDFTHGTGRI